MKRINIITTTYNDAHKYLMETIRSVKNQQFDVNKVEVIHTIVNDGSNNENSLLSLEFIDKKYDVKIINQENMGLPGARNTGIESIESDYILPLDADDLIDPLFIANFYSKFNKKELENCLFYTNWKSFGNYDRKLVVRKPTPYTIRYANYLPVCALIPTKIISENKYDSKMSFGFEDWDLWIRLICGGISLHHIDYFGFHHREQENNLTSKNFINYKKACKYFRLKYKDLYSAEYSAWSKKEYPPNLYDLFRCNTNPRLRFSLINLLSKIKLF